jgi:hypothetical protein
MWLSHSRLVPVPEVLGSSHSTWSWSPEGPDGLESDGWGSSHPMSSWGSAGPAGRWVQGSVGIPESCGTGSGLGSSADGWLWIPVFVDPAKGWASWHGVGLEAGGRHG